MKKCGNIKTNKRTKVLSLEEEIKTQRNFSKLIHTVQHISSTRSRLDHLDQGSLGKLINELETFEPTMSSKSSFQVTKTTESKHFSRKYLNLRLYPCPEKSNLQSAVDSKSKCKYNCKGKDIPMTSNKFQKPKNRNDQNPNKSERSNTEHFKENHQGKKNKSLYTSKRYVNGCNGNKAQCISNKKQCTSNIASSELSEKVKTSFKCKEEVIDSKNPENTAMNGKRKSSVVTKMNFFGRTQSKCSEETEKTTQQPSVSSGVCKPKLGNKMPVLIMDSTLRSKSCPHHVFKPYQSVTKFRGSKRFLAEVQPSMVKDLTHYWNNILNNEFEGYCSAPESFEINTSTTKSFENSVNKWYVSEGDKRTTVTLQDDTEFSVNAPVFRKESNENVHCLYSEQYLKKPPDKRQTLQDELDQIHEKQRSLKSIQPYSLEEPSFRNILSHPSSLEVFGNQQNTPLGDCDKTNLMSEGIDLKTETAIEVMKKLISKLKKYPETSLTSNEIDFSKSIKVMLCLITARVSSLKEEFSENKEVLDSPLILELEEPVNIFSNTDEFPVAITPNSSKATNKEILTEPFPSIIKEDSLSLTEYENYCEVRSLIPTIGITIQKVNDALNYLRLCKDCVWMKFILDPFFANTNSRDDHPLPNYRIVYEGEIIFEEENHHDEDGDFWDFEADKSEDESDDETIMDLYKRVSIVVEENIYIFKELISKQLVEHWTVSLSLLKYSYYLFMFLIIFWLVMKEIILK